MYIRPITCFFVCTITLCAAFETDKRPKQLYRGWETIPVVPHVSGLRIEDKPYPAAVAFLGYTEAGETIIEPDTKAIVIVFGYWLQKVEYLAFTDSNCITAEFTIHEASFLLQTERRIELEMAFPDVDESWRVCVKQKGEFGELLLVDDIRTWISTTATVPQHFLPLSAQVAIISVLFSLSALFSGLNLGLMSISVQELQLIINSGSKKERRYAESILPIRRRGNYLLCTILIMNVVVNSAISILFEDLTSGTVAFIAASLGIVILGEIVPQSICVKNGLAVGAKTVYLTKFFMLLTLPLAWPISKLLDCLLGVEVERYDRKRLIEILKMQGKNESKEFAADLQIAVGAMEIANKTVREVMTRIDDAFMVSANEVLNNFTVAHILKKGYTRVPVYEDNDRNKVRSLLFVNDLALVDLKNNVKVKEVSQMSGHILRIVPEDMPLTDLLEEFKRGDYHLAMVEEAEEENTATGWLAQKLAEYKQNDFCITLADPTRSSELLETSSSCTSSHRSSAASERESEATEPLICDQPSVLQMNSRHENRALVGLITLEDIIEEILQAEIIDETDTIFDNSHRLKRRQTNFSMLDRERRAEQLPLHTLQVVLAFLRTHFLIFSPNAMAENVLRRLIQSNIRQVNSSKRKNESADQQHITTILEAGREEKRAVLILEGTLDAYFPQHDMHFIVGPWEIFGGSQLEKCNQELRGNRRVANLTFTPDFTLQSGGCCKFLQIPFTSLMRAVTISQFTRSLSSASTSRLVSKSEEMTGRKISIQAQITFLSFYIQYLSGLKGETDLDSYWTKLRELSSDTAGSSSSRKHSDILPRKALATHSSSLLLPSCKKSVAF